MTTDIDSLIRDVSLTNTVRRNNAKQNLSQALRAGRILFVDIKPQIQHGEWIRWLQQNAPRMGYTGRDPVRKAQADMRLWNVWSPYVPRLIEMGAIPPSFNEDDIIQTMTDDQFDLSLSVMYEMTRKHITSDDIDMFLSNIQDDGSPTINSTKKSLLIKQTSQNLPVEKQKSLQHAVSLYDMTSDVISRWGELNADIVEEIVNTGYVTTFDVDTDDYVQVHVSNISKNDLVLAQKSSEREKHLRKIQHIQGNTGYTYLTNVEGTIEEIVNYLQTIPNNKKYKVAIYCEEI